MAEVISLATLQANLKKRNRTRADGQVQPRQPHHVQKKVVNPTLSIPNEAGFSGLSKDEVKRDTKEIEKSCFYMCSTDSDSEDGEDDAGIRSMLPCPVPEVVVTAKKQRFMAWIADASKMENDLTALDEAIEKGKYDHAIAAVQQEDWLTSLELARFRLSDSMQNCREDNIVLDSTAKHILSIHYKHMNKTYKPTKSSTLKDLYSALALSQNKLDHAISNASSVMHVTMDGSAFVDAVKITPTMVVIPTAPPKRQVKGPMGNWICAACAFHNTFTSAMDKTCVGCGRDYFIPEVEESAPVEIATTIEHFMRDAEQRVITREALCRDIDAFFPVDEDESTTMNSIHDIEDEGSKSARRSDRVAPLLSHVDMEALARGLVEQHSQELYRVMLEDAGKPSRSRRKRKHSISLSTFVTPRTPRDCPLLVSSLSQHPDRFIAAVMGDTKGCPEMMTSDAVAPDLVKGMEEPAFAKCALKGLVRITERDSKVISSGISEWEQQGLEALIGLKKAEHTYSIVRQENEAERAKYSATSLLGCSVYSDEMKETHVDKTTSKGNGKGKKGSKADDCAKAAMKEMKEERIKLRETKPPKGKAQSAPAVAVKAGKKTYAKK